MKTLTLMVYICALPLFGMAQVIDSLPAQVENPNSLNDYELDINKSKVNWSIGTTRGSQNGEIKFRTGVLRGNEKSQVLGRSEFEINMTTISCGSIPLGMANTQVVLMLKADNFFDAYRYPSSYLKFISIEKLKEDSKFQIKGLMTIKGVEQEVEFTAVGKFHDGLFEGVAKGISIDRREYGIAFNKTGLDNDVAQQINSSIDQKFVIDVYLVAEKK
jgi:polyisoprenoid-binding protein YceI